MSSTCSTLTELSSRCSEDIERNAGSPVSPTPHAPNLSTIVDVNLLLSTTPNAALVSVAPHPWFGPNLDTNPPPLSVPCPLPASAVGPSSTPDTPALQDPTKKPRRRQKNKKKKKKKSPISDEAVDVEVEHKHQQKRMDFFKAWKSREKSKQTRMDSARFKKVLSGVTPIPFEPSQFRPSLKVKHEPRVYRHEELAALGVRTMPWDGR